jgi:hypothetical protein
MAGEVLTLSRALKIVFEEARAPIADFLTLFFPQTRTYQETEIPVDRIVNKKILAAYRDNNAASNLVAYNPGQGIVYSPPTLAEATPIDESLAHSVIAGLEASASASERTVRLVSEIRAQHDDMITRAVVKQGVDALTLGSFQPADKSGNPIGRAFDFGRDPDNTISANYAATPLKQWQDAYDQYAKKGGALTSRVVLVGSEWLSAIEKNPDFVTALSIQRGATDAYHNLLTGENRMISAIVEMKIPGRSARATILVFNESFDDGSGELTPFINPRGLLVTSLNAPRMQLYAGIWNVNQQTGQGQVTAGQMVSDAFWSKDPDNYVLRSQSRPLLIPGNVDHSVWAVSTNAYT